MVEMEAMGAAAMLQEQLSGLYVMQVKMFQI